MTVLPYYMARRRLGPAGGGGSVEIALVATGSEITSTATRTYAGMDFGAEAADRVLFAALTIDRSTSLDREFVSVTIGGVSASVAISTPPIVDTMVARRALIVYATVPTGLSGDVVVVNDDTTDRDGCSLYRATGLDSITPHHTASGTAPGPFNIDILAGGFAIGVGAWAGTTPAITWTNLTEQSEITRGTNRTHSSAMSPSETEQTVAVSASSSVSNTDSRVVLASWR
jgi:hypothetical protein